MTSYKIHILVCLIKVIIQQEGISGKWIHYIKHNLIILGELRDLCETYHERICGIESAKYDTEKEVEFKDYQITDLNIAVNDLRGKL